MSLYCNLGEMKSESGEALDYEVRKLTSDFAVKLSKIIKDYPFYKKIEEILPSPKTLLYFQKIIGTEIGTVIRELCVIRWYKRNNKPLREDQNIILIPKSGIYLLLEQIWPDKDVAIRYARNSRKNFFSGRSLRMFGRQIFDFWHKWRYSKIDFDHLKMEEAGIALQYAEGINLDRRSDIVWFPASQIDPRRVLIYFDHAGHTKGKPISEDILQSIEKLGVKWVCLNPGSIARKNVPVWYPHFSVDRSLKTLGKPHDLVEKWIYQKAAVLLKEVNYWAAFYKTFNIKLNFVIGEGSPYYIAQSIAFDFNGRKGGFLVGKQRSECFVPPEAYLGSHPKDIFFVWNRRTKKYVKPDINLISSYVVTGNANAVTFENKINEASRLKLRLKSKGANFIVALFDNVHGSHTHFSSEMMERFYLVFFDWLFEDKTLGIIIKSKKPLLLNNLPRVLAVLAKAESTGRFIRLGNVFGRLPADAALASEMTVGIGISSAVIESAVVGVRGIHCDLTCLRSHEYYKWGYERIIFDNLDRMMVALKRYKDNRAADPDLGDWSPFLDKLDPFRDGRAGERMGTYLRWLLEGFDSGLNRESILDQANKKYAKAWGAENIQSAALEKADQNV